MGARGAVGRIRYDNDNDYHNDYDYEYGTSTLRCSHTLHPTPYTLNPTSPRDCHIETGLVAGPVDVAPLAWPDDCGAECIFLGRTRIERHGEFGRLLRLEYEAYAPMVEKLMVRMARDAAERFSCRAVRLVHATGVVEPGAASVVIQVATGHRAASFDACRYLIERLKAELPIWKREVWERGQTYVEGSGV